jgi:hypothetical protein
LRSAFVQAGIRYSPGEYLLFLFLQPPQSVAHPVILGPHRSHLRINAQLPCIFGRTARIPPHQQR